MTVEEWLGADNQIGLDIWHKKYQNNNETFEDWLQRISGGNEDIKQLIREKKFLFGGRILANRGLDANGTKVTMSNCYVVMPPEDNIESIFECAKKLARTYSYGGGCGVDISKLAPRGAKVNNTAKETSGAVSFMDLYSLTTGLIGQNGRRGALMISISSEHPDLEEFIGVKADLSKVTKANISVRMSDAFMTAAENDQPYNLTYTRDATGEIISKTINAKEVFRKIAEMNWRTAEPGILFWDRIKNWNLLSNTSEFSFAGTNPCAEEPLPAGGSCLLGSLNLSEFVNNPFAQNAMFDMESFEKAIRVSVRGLNEVLTYGLPLHPLEEQRDSVKRWKQIGLGVMGIADMLIKLGIKYGSQKSIDTCNEIADNMIKTALDTSEDEVLRKGEVALTVNEFGNTPYYKAHECGVSQLYNSQLLTIAPTGTLSTMLGISGGIEPIFANYYTRRTESLYGKPVEYKVYTPIVKQYMDAHNIADESNLPEYFITAPEIDYHNRIAMQSMWQQHVDASISSTINLPEDATIDDIVNIYMEAWHKGLKGITIYRAGCERDSILTATTDTKDKSDELTRGIIEDVPEGLTYRKYKIKSGCGKLYLFIGIDEDEGKIYDFFTNTDGVGGCTVSTQANSRLMSAALRGGVPIEYIIEQLQKSGTCPSYQYARGQGKELNQGRSCPSAIAYVLQALNQELKNDVREADEIDIPDAEESSTDFTNRCPECGAELKHEGGCLVCSCGWSRCE